MTNIAISQDRQPNSTNWEAPFTTPLSTGTQRAEVLNAIAVLETHNIRLPEVLESMAVIAFEEGHSQEVSKLIKRAAHMLATTGE
jgi:hypothetical protein